MIDTTKIEEALNTKVRSVNVKEITRTKEEAEKELVKYNEFNFISSSCFNGADTRTEINTYLKEKAGFENPVFCADSMGIKLEYERCLELLDRMEIDKSTIVFKEGRYILKPEYVKEIEEKYTAYWSKENLAEMKKVKRFLDSYNTLKDTSKFSIHRTRSGFNFDFNTFYQYSVRKPRG